MSEPTEHPGNTRAAQKTDIKIFTLRFFPERESREPTTFAMTKQGEGLCSFGAGSPSCTPAAQRRAPSLP